MLAPGTVDGQSPVGPIQDSRSVLARYTGAAALARLADEGSRVALLLAALQHGRGPAFGGLLVAALMVPHVLAAPLIGALADRTRNRKLLYLAGLTGYGTALVAAAALIGPAPWAAFLLVTVAGCVAPLLIGGLTSLLGELAPGNLHRAYGLDATSYGAAGIAGPAVAALLAAAFGAVWATGALTVACLLSASLVATLPIRRRPPGQRPERRGGALRALWRSPSLASATAGTSVSQIGMGALPVVLAVVAVRQHDPALTGIALSVMAAGNLVSSLAYTAHPITRWRPERVVLVLLAALAGPFALMALLPGTVALLGLFALAGLINGPLFCVLLAVRDREAPAAVRTRVFTLGAGLKVTAAAAGAALAGWSTGLGPAVLLLTVAAVQVLAAATGTALIRRPAPPASP
jgi:MFS family permease